MDTPLDNVPPARWASGAPFGAGSGLAAGGGGGVAAIGIAGSTFRLLENICIGLDLLQNDHGTVIHKGQPCVWKWSRHALVPVRFILLLMLLIVLLIFT
jgi:hypothetical protein